MLNNTKVCRVVSVVQVVCEMPLYTRPSNLTVLVLILSYYITTYTVIGQDIVFPMEGEKDHSLTNDWYKIVDEDVILFDLNLIPKRFRRDTATPTNNGDVFNNNSKDVNSDGLGLANDGNLIFIPQTPRSDTLLPKLEEFARNQTALLTNYTSGLVKIANKVIDDVTAKYENKLNSINDKLSSFHRRINNLQQLIDYLVKLTVYQQQQQQMRFAYDGAFPMMPPLPYYPTIIQAPTPDIIQAPTIQPPNKLSQEYNNNNNDSVILFT